MYLLHAAIIRAPRLYWMYNMSVVVFGARKLPFYLLEGDTAYDGGFDGKIIQKFHKDSTEGRRLRMRS